MTAQRFQKSFTYKFACCLLVSSLFLSTAGGVSIFVVPAQKPAYLTAQEWCTLACIATVQSSYFAQKELAPVLRYCTLDCGYEMLIDKEGFFKRYGS